jgi:hypothetical protein
MFRRPSAVSGQHVKASRREESLNEGKLDGKRREGESEKLTDDEVASIEATVLEVFDGYEGHSNASLMGKNCRLLAFGGSLGRIA